MCKVQAAMPFNHPAMFVRKKCFDELGINSVDLIKIGGGSSKNTLWNSIRANVMNKRIAVADEKELSIVGLINYMMETKRSLHAKPAINFLPVYPEPYLVKVYDARYEKFIRYQNLSVE